MSSSKPGRWRKPRRSLGGATQIPVLARTIGALEDALRGQNRVAAESIPPRTKGKRGAFSKLRVGAVPARSPTPPEPRDRMDRPDLEVRPPDLLDPFTKAPTPGPGSLR